MKTKKKKNTPKPNKIQDKKQNAYKQPGGCSETPGCSGNLNAAIQKEDKATQLKNYR